MAFLPTVVRFTCRLMGILWRGDGMGEGLVVANGSGLDRGGRCCPIWQDADLVGHYQPIRNGCLFQANAPAGLLKQFRVGIVA